MGELAAGSRIVGTPAAAHSWRHLLTMTRGSQTDGPWDIDEIVALPSGQVSHMAQAPQLTPPGAVFRYDNASAHLISAGLQEVVGSAVADYAERVGRSGSRIMNGSPIERASPSAMRTSSSAPMAY